MGSQHEPTVSSGEDSVAAILALDAVQGMPPTVQKVAAVGTSRDQAVGEPLASALPAATLSPHVADSTPTSRRLHGEATAAA